MFPSLGDQVGSCFKIARIRETKVVNDRIESLAKIRATEFLDLRFMLPGHHRQIPARPLSKLSEDCQLRCLFVVCSRFVGEVENFFRWTVFGRGDGCRDGCRDDTVEANQTKQDVWDASKHGHLRIDRWIEVGN